MSAHTKGPWTHTPMQDTIWANDGETKIATIADLPWVESVTGRRQSDFDTEQANARLIACAPDLLRACELALGQLRGSKSLGGVHSASLAADIRILEETIASAKGETK